MGKSRPGVWKGGPRMEAFPRSVVISGGYRIGARGRRRPRLGLRGGHSALGWAGATLHVAGRLVGGLLAPRRVVVRCLAGPGVIHPVRLSCPNIQMNERTVR